LTDAGEATAFSAQGAMTTVPAVVLAILALRGLRS
jgi:hypothetical protein